MSGGTLVRAAAILAAGSLLAGCSSGVTRFQDDFFTGSTANQRQIIGPADYQPFPGDVAQKPSVDAAATGSVARTAVTPVPVLPAPSAAPAAVERSSLPPVAAAAPARPAPQPVQAASAEPAPLDRTVTNTTPRPARPAIPEAQPVRTSEGERKAGWSRAGGTEVTVREGETVYNLSRRFGVPVDAIVAANGLSSADALTAGQKVVIPTYVYSAKAPVSAPDSVAEVQEAKSSRGTKFDVPADKVPVPSRAPAEKVAVLPQTPKPKEEAAAAPSTANAEPKASRPETEAKPQAGNAYTVVSGDTLYGIAKKTGTTAAAIKAANGLSDGYLKIGQKLTIPADGAQPVMVASADKNPGVDPVVTGTAGPAKKPSAKEAAPVREAVPVNAYTPPRKADKVIEEAEQVAAVAPETTGVGRMRWPVRGRIVSSYGGGGGSRNDGIDIAVPEGTPVKAAENGVVIYAGDGLKEFGNTVLVRHEDGLVTVYGHASELKVARGEKVKRGQEIARSGMSGAAETPKLHFEVRKDSAPVDPSGYLE